MAQKNKVKELVGRGLNSYHTKSLQQIDRIEKKNKEQNHKISILSNELDNDYLTKTEEGFVISLEHSKEGMVYLDELQGNTLVNYCTDGSKEMTLNGDIDIEGTFVTTTEGVDNGLVDVACEGNTMVNLIGGSWYYGTTETKNDRECFKIAVGSSANHNQVTNIKSGVPYTLIYNYMSTELIKGTINPFGRLHLTLSNENGWVYDVPVNNFISSQSNFTTSISVFTIPTNIQFTAMSITGILRDIEGTVWLDKNVMLLEGDWSNKEIPSYFKGMKSVGQDDTNGHKIEILYSNKNLFTNINAEYTKILKEDGSYKIIDISDGTELTDFIKVKPNTTYIFSGKQASSNSNVKRISLFDVNKNFIKQPLKVSNTIINFSYTFTTDSNTRYIKLSHYKNDTNVQIEEGTIVTSYSKRMLNKKEILLNEPLRGLPSGVKDKKVKIGNKWYIERKCKQETFDGSSDENWYVQNSNLENYSIFKLYVKNTPYASSGGRINQITDIINSEVPTWSNLLNIEKECTHLYGDKLLYVKISNSKLDTQDIDGFIKWLKNNNINIVYELATPIYEPLEVEPILNTYNDITHISNNSIIPCNMKIKNTGYNVIIKPSTLYTVALDTDKARTIGINLGGAKGTTTNNVLKLTTPATLADDSLRLYGKGIKGSKVRLLEGDKTNWIPSYFEGMKSSFEDKFDATDNTYKMEILSNKGGMNLCTNSDDIRGSVASGIILEKVDDKGYKNVTKLSGNLSANWFSVSSRLVTKISPNTTVTISVLARTDKPNNKSKLSFYLGDGQPGDYVDFEESLSNEYKWVSQTRKFISNSFRPHFGLLNFNGHSVYISKMKIEFGNKMTEWCPSIKDASWSEYKNYNKIQFSSIEPLRSVGDIKDKFVFKDGRLLIERNIHRFIADGTYVSHITKNSYESEKSCACLLSLKSEPKHIRTDKLNTVQCDKYSTYVHLDAIWGSKTIHQGISNVNGTYDFAIREYNSKTTINPSDTHDTLMSKFRTYLNNNPIEIEYVLVTPTYEEIPFELQKIILEGYENGTLFIDTNIPPTSTVTYAGETPIVKATKLNKTEVLNNTNDINDNIVPYLMDMDYRVVCLQLATEENEVGVSMARLFGGAYEMLQRDIQSKRYSIEEYRHRLDAYLSANKITEEEYIKLGDMLNE